MAEVTFLEALRQGLWEEMERDERVFILGEDVGSYGGAFKVTEGFSKRFGESRVIDTPISEAAIVGAAAGAAHMGLRPIAEMQFIDFISCAYDMLTNYVATARYRAGLSTPMVVRGPCGGYVRGGPFHSQTPEAAFLHTPGLKIVYPATARDAKGLIKSAIRDEDPVLYLEHKWLYRRIKEQLPEGEEILTPIGQARLAREGKHLSIISYGATLWKSLEAAERLDKEDGVAVEVLDLRTLLPMDDAAIVATVKKTNKVLIVHEDTRTGGIAGEIAARINEQAFEWLDGPIMRVTAHDVPLPYAPTLEDFVLPQTEDIVKAARGGPGGDQGTGRADRAGADGRRGAGNGSGGRSARACETGATESRRSGASRPKTRTAESYTRACARSGPTGPTGRTGRPAVRPSDRRRRWRRRPDGRATPAHQVHTARPENCRRAQRRYLANSGQRLRGARDQTGHPRIYREGSHGVTRVQRTAHRARRWCNRASDRRAVAGRPRRAVVQDPQDHRRPHGHVEARIRARRELLRGRFHARRAAARQGEASLRRARREPHVPRVHREGVCRESAEPSHHQCCGIR